MDTLTCTRRLTFCAGHRVMGHENKCAHLHGHNYEVEITASAPQLDSIGRVVDFSVLKVLVGSWIESNWDHGFILNSHDAAAIAAVGNFEVTLPDTAAPKGKKVRAQKIFLLPFNPTAENLAEYLLNTVCAGANWGKSEVRVIHVRVWETENCFADAYRDDS